MPLRLNRFRKDRLLPSRSFCAEHPPARKTNHSRFLRCLALYRRSRPFRKRKSSSDTSSTTTQGRVRSRTRLPYHPVARQGQTRPSTTVAANAVVTSRKSWKQTMKILHWFHRLRLHHFPAAAAGLASEHQRDQETRRRRRAGLNRRPGSTASADGESSGGTPPRSRCTCPASRSTSCATVFRR